MIMGQLTKMQMSVVKKVFAAAHAKRDAADAAAPEIIAIKVTYAKPQPDGTFEILFMRRAEADAYKNPHDSFETISFEKGVTLARQTDCCGGLHALHSQARRFQRLNPSVQKLNLDLT